MNLQFPRKSPPSEVSMKTPPFRAWYRPKTILIVSDLTEHPARTLQTIGKFRRAGAKLFLLSLQRPGYAVSGTENAFPLLLNHGFGSQELPADDTRRAVLWTEILSEATILGNSSLEQLPQIAESIGADIVLLIAPDIRATPLNAPRFDAGLVGSFEAPVLIFSRHVDLESWNRDGFHRVLVPINFGPGLAGQLRFACNFAQRYHCRLTVLHVFEGRGPVEHHWERTPVAVEARLPLADLKREGLLCPMEIAVSEGYPEQTIPHFNERKHFDLIIMGEPHFSVQRSFGHSVVESVTVEAHCPVVIIGQRRKRGPTAVESAFRLTSA
jgi:nucleotide-binding universal stress UspA family protein